MYRHNISFVIPTSLPSDSLKEGYGHGMVCTRRVEPNEILLALPLEKCWTVPLADGWNRGWSFWSEMAKWPHFGCSSRIIVAKLSRIHYSTNRSILVLKYFNCSMQRCWDETFISKDCVFWNLPVVGMLLGIFSHFRLIHLHLGKNKRYWDQPLEMLWRCWKELRVAK